MDNKKQFVAAPGCFSPPTIGHLNYIKEASQCFEEVNIVCSRNIHKKKYWFSQEECAQMWHHMDLPENVRIYTFDEIKKMFSVPYKNFIVVRGIKNIDCLSHEKTSLLTSLEKFGVDKFFFVFAKEEYKNISSGLLRKMAENVDLINLSNKTCPFVISKLIEKALEINKIFIVAGRTGSGKTKIIKELSKKYPIESIDIDLLVKELHHLVKNHFKTDDVFSLVQSRPDDVADFLKIPLVEKLEKCIKKMKKENKLQKETILLIECAYALKYELFKYTGGRTLYIHSDKNKQRLLERKTPQHLEFIDKVPDFEETQKICKKYKLELNIIENNNELKEEGLRKIYSKITKA